MSEVNMMNEPGREADDPTTGRSSIDDIIELYKRDVDRTLLRENLKLTPTERLEKLRGMQRFAAELRRARRDIRDER